MRRVLLILLLVGLRWLLLVLDNVDVGGVASVAGAAGDDHNRLPAQVAVIDKARDEAQI